MARIPLIGARVDVTLTGAVVETVHGGGAYIQLGLDNHHYHFSGVDSQPGVTWSFAAGGLVQAGECVRDARGVRWQVTDRGMWSDGSGLYLPDHALKRPLTPLVPAQSPAVAS